MLMIESSVSEAHLNFVRSLRHALCSLQKDISQGARAIAQQLSQNEVVAGPKSMNVCSAVSGHALYFTVPLVVCSQKGMTIGDRQASWLSDMLPNG